ncbi:MAG: P1 family peptidase [Pseudomonadota bacterium]
MNQPRARDLGLDFPGKTGSHNAITDVDGVAVGFETLIDDRRNICTGVSAIVPRSNTNEPIPVLAGQSTLNGNGEMTGTHWVNDAGHFLGPICITNTHSVGIVHHAAVQWMIERYSAKFADDHLWAMPVVAETYDGSLNDINGLHVTAQHALNALRCATGGAIAEGNVGGGTGMRCYGFKGGTGTASRRVEFEGCSYTVGSLVQANHGIREWLTVLGVPAGKHLPEDAERTRETGSIIGIIATDAPLSPTSLKHLARRAALGVGRGGTPGGNSSGDIFLAFSTAHADALRDGADALQRFEFFNPNNIDALYLAAVESVEESVINAMVAAKDRPIIKPPGSIAKAIDHEQLRSIMRQFNRLIE